MPKPQSTLPRDGRRSVTADNVSDSTAAEVSCTTKPTDRDTFAELSRYMQTPFATKLIEYDTQLRSVKYNMADDRNISTTVQDN